VYLSATALVGIGRYLVLRLSVFAQRAPVRKVTADGRSARSPARARPGSAVTAARHRRVLNYPLGVAVDGNSLGLRADLSR
jgi:hypothetical protein